MVPSERLRHNEEIIKVDCIVVKGLPQVNDDFIRAAVIIDRAARLSACLAQPPPATGSSGAVP